MGRVGTEARASVAMPEPMTLDVPPLLIDARRSGVREQLMAIWRYRELLYFLAWRDLKIRYRQTALGAAWAIIQPVSTMLVFWVFFGRLAGVPSGGAPYPLFAYCGLLPWLLFAHALSESSASLVNNRSLVTKVYFPRLIVPIAPLFVALVDFAVAFGVLTLLMLVYGIVPGLRGLAVPLFVLVAAMVALAVGVWLAALNVRYRDVRYAVPFVTQLWFFLTPVVYPSGLLAEPWRTLYGLNPMAGVVEGFRWALLGQALPLGLIVVSTGALIVLLFGGLWYFARTEDTIADDL